MQRTVRTLLECILVYRNVAAYGPSVASSRPLVWPLTQGQTASGRSAARLLRVSSLSAHQRHLSVSEWRHFNTENLYNFYLRNLSVNDWCLFNTNKQAVWFMAKLFYIVNTFKMSLTEKSTTLLVCCAKYRELNEILSVMLCKMWYNH